MKQTPEPRATEAAAPIAPLPQQGKLRRWVWDLRTHSRFAYVLQISSRIGTSALALVWYRILVGVMGEQLYSLFQAFQTVFSLGGLGDLGMGGAVGIRLGRYLGEGRGKEQEMLKFLASARSVFLVLTLVCGGGMLLFSPWLPQWLAFPAVGGAGSYARVVMVGALAVAGVMLLSYFSNVNYACGNIAWPVLPDFLLLQVALLCHWFLALEQQPLWVQFLPYMLTGLARVWFMWFYVRASHPHLARLLPLAFDWQLAVNLFEGSFWVYLCCLGNAVYRSTDALVINAGFTPGTLVGYSCNYRFCELTNFVVFSASYVILPKLTQWMASSDSKDQERVQVEMRRLNQFQILLGCAAVLSYLAFNDTFIRLWWRHAAKPILPAALPLQIAFALNMAVTACGDTALQLTMRAGKKGLRVVGTLVAIMGLVNIGLSVAAMKMGSLTGIAMATVLAQSGLMLGSSYYLCRYLKIPWSPWAFKGCIMPLAGVSLAGWLRMRWPMDSLPHIAMLLGAYAAIFLATARGLGLNAAVIKDELKIIRKLVSR